MPADDPDIWEEQLSRNKQFFAERCVMTEKGKTWEAHDGQADIEDASVVVVGLGGVGSHAAHMLARAGIKRLRLIDFDQVTLSSLNRHAVADRADVGKPKVVVCAEHFARFNPRCAVEPVTRMFTAQSAEGLLFFQDGREPDFVLDCIDDSKTKAELLAFCVHRGLKVLSSLGAGAKSDPTRLRISDMTDVLNDKLGGKLRKILAEQHGIEWPKRTSRAGSHPEECPGVLVLHSTENAVSQLLPLTEEQKRRGAHEFGAVDNFRVRVLPVLGTTPAIFGIAAAAYILTQIGGKPFDPAPVRCLSTKLERKYLQNLQRREKDVYGVQDKSKVEMTPEGVAFLIQTVWRRRCAYTGAVMDTTRGGRFVFTRWDRSKPASCDNLLFVTEKAAKAHEAATLRTGSVPSALLGAIHKDDDPLLHDKTLLQFIRVALAGFGEPWRPNVEAAQLTQSNEWLRWQWLAAGFIAGSALTAAALMRRRNT